MLAVIVASESNAERMYRLLWMAVMRTPDCARRIDCLALLTDLGSAMLVSERVLAEVETGLAKDADAGEILTWATAFGSQTVSVPDLVAGWDLGAGEAQVILLCLQGPSRCAVLDDGEARRCTLSVDVPMIGSSGILHRAKRKGLVTKVRPLTDRLLRSGFYLDQTLLDRVLARTAEYDDAVQALVQGRYAPGGLAGGGGSAAGCSGVGGPSRSHTGWSRSRGATAVRGGRQSQRPIWKSISACVGNSPLLGLDPSPWPA
jgi:predicted nucleic acid-binding protein